MNAAVYTDLSAAAAVNSAMNGTATTELRVEASASAAWVDTMLQLREAKIANAQACAEVTQRLRLDELTLTPWRHFEFALFGQAGRSAWDWNQHSVHDFGTPLEAIFSETGVIDPRMRYRSAIKDGPNQPQATFRPSIAKDNELWSSPHRHNNRIDYYWRTVDVDEARTLDLHLGFNEGCRVFLNGEAVFSEQIIPARVAAPNQAKVTLHLKAGTNHLLLKLTSWKLGPREHRSYCSFLPVPELQLYSTGLDLFAQFPIQADWFLQDLDRMRSEPLGADLTLTAVSKNLLAYCAGGRGTDFEQVLVRRVLSELTDVSDYEARLNGLIAAQADASDAGWLSLYVEACEARRSQRLASVEAKTDKILFAKRKMLRPSFYGYTEGLSTANFEKNFVPGSSLCLLELKNGVAQVTELLSDEDGAFRDIDVSYDGTRILFAWKQNSKEDDYHLYEMSWPDRTVRQLTSGLAVADFEGRYLPTGDLLFSSSRCIATTDCWVTETSNLHLCDADGQNIRRIGYDQVVTCYPTVRDDGSVLYTRWDYNDRGQVYPQALFQMNADGTAQTEYYGNNSWFPTAMNHARGIPGTDKVIAVLHGHHTWQAGELAVIDRSKGTQEASGVQVVAPVRAPEGPLGGYIYEEEDGQVRAVSSPLHIAKDRYGQRGNLHRHPYPLDKDSLLVAMTPYMNAREDGERSGIRFHLYWMDLDGNRELLAYDPSVSSAHPIPLAARALPAVRATQTNERVGHGTYFMQDIYEGPGLAGVERGTIKKLRVVEIEYRALKVGSNTSGGRGGGAMASTPISTGNGSWDVKRILGEAKVYADGSAMFKVPAYTPVFFQAIDGDGQMVQTMRSWSTLMPNETFSCVGCHEDKNSTPPPGGMSLAMKAGAQELNAFQGPERGFSFLKEIQPILDRRCIDCHDGSTEVEGELLMDLTARVFEDRQSKRKWTQSYLNLTHSEPKHPIRGDADHPSLNWVSAQSVPSMIPPYFRGAARSEWFQKLREGHGEMTQNELELFAAWIDLSVPFCGDYVEANAWTDEEFLHYLQMQRKRERLEAESRESRAALLEQQTGEIIVLAEDPPLYQNYIQSRGIDLADLQRGYRNLALNPDGKRGEFPQTSSNSVCRDLPEFSHVNVVNGRTENHGHGKRFPSWGPDLEGDHWLKVDLGEDYEVDKLVITIRADFPHDSYWKSGVLTFSDGSTHPFELKPTAQAQTLIFPVRKASWVMLSGLKAAEEKWCALTEVAVWGREPLERR